MHGREDGERHTIGRTRLLFNAFFQHFLRAGSIRSAGSLRACMHACMLRNLPLSPLVNNFLSDSRTHLRRFPGYTHICRKATLSVARNLRTPVFGAMEEKPIITDPLRRSPPPPPLPRGRIPRIARHICFRRCAAPLGTARPRFKSNALPVSPNTCVHRFRWQSLGALQTEVRLDFTLPTGQSFRWRRTGDQEFTGVVHRRVVRPRSLHVYLLVSSARSARRGCAMAMFSPAMQQYSP